MTTEQACSPCARLGLALLLARCARGLDEAVESRLAPLGLRTRALGLACLARAGGGATQRSLGRSLNVDRTSMVALVDDLEKRGLVERRASPEDRRCHRIGLSAEGERVLRRAERASAEAEDEFLAPLARAERVQLRRLLVKLVVRLEAS